MRKQQFVAKLVKNNAIKYADNVTIFRICFGGEHHYAVGIEIFPFLNVPLQRKQRNRGKTVLNWTFKYYKKKKSGTYICYQSIEKTRRHWFLSEILKATNWFENIVPLWLPHSFHSIHFQLVCCNFDAVFVPFFHYVYFCVCLIIIFANVKTKEYNAVFVRVCGCGFWMKTYVFRLICVACLFPSKFTWNTHKITKDTFKTTASISSFSHTSSQFHHLLLMAHETICLNVFTLHRIINMARLFCDNHD